MMKITIVLQAIHQISTKTITMNTSSPIFYSISHNLTPTPKSTTWEFRQGNKNKNCKNRNKNKGNKNNKLDDHWKIAKYSYPTWNTNYLLCSKEPMIYQWYLHLAMIKIKTIKFSKPMSLIIVIAIVIVINIKLQRIRSVQISKLILKRIVYSQFCMPTQESLELAIVKKIHWFP